MAMEVVVHTDSGDVKLNPTIVRRYLVNGDGPVTDQEIALFLGLCKYQQLNPFLREAYLIKYGSQPATIVVAKETFLKRAQVAKGFKGLKAGVITQTPQKEVKYYEGIVPPGDALIGGWAEVHLEAWAFPLRLEVSLQEYQGRKKDGSINRMWTEKPATMIRKVALVQALREAFPSQFKGIYSEEEVPVDAPLPTESVNVIDVGDVPPPASNGDRMTATEVRASQPKPVQEAAPSAPDAPSAPPQLQENPSFRRRRNKFRVDPNVFGANEIVTCGCTDKQLIELTSISRLALGMRDWITAKVKEVTTYDQWSFMREDEAVEILGAAREHLRTLEVPAAATAAPDPEPVPANGQPTGTDAPVESQGPAPAQEIPQPLNPADQAEASMVECPARPGDKVLESFCRADCRDRKQMGWCPAIDDEPPQASSQLI
jgi:phage recombination protein Bet